MAKKITPLKQPDKLVNYWKKEPLTVIFILIFGLSFNILFVFWPVYQGKLLDSIIDDKPFSDILTLALLFTGLVALIQVLRFLKRFYIRRFANSTVATMRLAIYNNIIYRNAGDIGKENVGNLMTRAVSDVDICVEGMRKFTTEIFDTAVLMISYIVTMLIYDVEITLLGVLFVPAAMFLAEKLKELIYKYSAAYRKKSGEVADITYDIVDNAILYRISGRERENSINYDSHLEDLRGKAVKAHILENSMQPVYNVIAMLGIVIVIYLGGVKAINGGWSVGAFSAYITMFAALAVKASKAAKLFNSVQKSQVSWQRLKPYLGGYTTKDKKAEITCGGTTLKVSDLSFTYCKDKGNVIENVNFEGREGEIIGITGAVATGKSTLAAALAGLYGYGGSIKIDGKELHDYSDNERSLMISYLSHKPQLMSDSIYNNITLGSGAGITEVLRDVDFDDDLAAMPDGADTLVGNGGIRLSGGQQSRIALARALINKNKIIILDDPFSAVDMKTEEHIIYDLKKNYRESLIILVSHRLAIFDRIDKVLLLNNDKSYLFGTHEELLKQSGVYSAIFSLQNIMKAEEADYEE